MRHHWSSRPGREFDRVARVFRSSEGAVGSFEFAPRSVALLRVGPVAFKPSIPNGIRSAALCWWEFTYLLPKRNRISRCVDAILCRSTNAVALSIRRLARELGRTVPGVLQNGFLLRFQVSPYELTVFVMAVPFLRARPIPRWHVLSTPNIWVPDRSPSLHAPEHLRLIGLFVVTPAFMPALSGRTKSKNEPLSVYSATPTRRAHRRPIQVLPKIHQRQKCTQHSRFQIICQMQSAGRYPRQFFAVFRDEPHDLSSPFMRCVSQRRLPPH